MRKLLLFLGLTLLLSGCGWLNPSIMLKTGKGFKYSTLSDSAANSKEYKLSPNDIVEFSIFTNDGFKLVDLTALNDANTAFRIQNSLEYLIDAEGYCKLPIIGKTKLSGMTIQQTQLMLEGLYAAYYVKPFVLLTVLNKRVIVFPGLASDAKVIPLRNNNTTLIEAIALAGGIAEDGKARRIKLIRRSADTSQVFLVDLSKISGIREANMVVQANDIIYIEPRRRISSRFLQEIAPIVSIIANVYVIFTYTQAVTK